MCMHITTADNTELVVSKLSQPGTHAGGSRDCSTSRSLLLSVAHACAGRRLKPVHTEDVKKRALSWSGMADGTCMKRPLVSPWVER